MGRNSGGIVDLGSGSAKSKQVAKAVATSSPLDSIADRAVVKELHRAISRYHAKMGVKEKNVRIADINGLGVTYIDKDGKSTGILLNASFFDRKKKVVENDYRINEYLTGHKSKTKTPLQHTLTHELAHATWNASMSSKNAKAAGKEISVLYQKWKNDNKKKGHGRYGRKDVSEFWAETVTKALHGDSDKYTRAVKRIAKKYKL